MNVLHLFVPHISSVEYYGHGFCEVFRAIGGCILAHVYSSNLAVFELLIIRHFLEKYGMRNLVDEGVMKLFSTDII